MANTQFLDRAKQLACQAHHNRNLHRPDYLQSTPDDYYVVWFCKTLGNWKALVSTDIKDGLYWEITHNGAKSETYIDTYNKIGNTVAKDG